MRSKLSNFSAHAGIRGPCIMLHICQVVASFCVTWTEWQCDAGCDLSQPMSSGRLKVAWVSGYGNASACQAVDIMWGDVRWCNDNTSHHVRSATPLWGDAIIWGDATACQAISCVTMKWTRILSSQSWEREVPLYAVLWIECTHLYLT